MGERARPRVLVVDGEPTARSLLTRILTDRGYSVEIAPDGPSALAACRRGRFMLVIVDLRTAGMEGTELAAKLSEGWPDTALVVVAGASDRATAIACMKAGAHDYVMKPFDLDDLLVRTERAMERRRLIVQSRLNETQLEARVRREMRAARRVLLGAIQALSSALEAKDVYTRGHSERVSRVAGKIAGEMGLPAEQRRRIKVAARLHDIGKIGVIESVLSKPGPLSQEEYRQIQAHPVIAEQILVPRLLDTETGKIVRHHHEHYGGGGYPDCLQGSDIPFGARLLAVADAFDALTSDRPYRGRLTLEAAFEVLRAGAGGQWQPTLVEALIHAVAQPPAGDR